MVDKKKSTRIRETPEQIRKRIAEEKKRVSSEPVYEDIEVSESKAPVLKENPTEYEIGQYLAEKEKWDVKVKSEKSHGEKVDVNKQSEQVRIRDSYMRILNSDEIPTEDDFQKMEHLLERYKQIT